MTMSGVERVLTLTQVSIEQGKGVFPLKEIVNGSRLNGGQVPLPGQGHGQTYHKLIPCLGGTFQSYTLVTYCFQPLPWTTVDLMDMAGVKRSFPAYCNNTINGVKVTEVFGEWIGCPPGTMMMADTRNSTHITLHCDCLVGVGWQ